MSRNSDAHFYTSCIHQTTRSLNFNYTVRLMFCSILHVPQSYIKAGRFNTLFWTRYLNLRCSSCVKETSWNKAHASCLTQSSADPGPAGSSDCWCVCAEEKKLHVARWLVSSAHKGFAPAPRSQPMASQYRKTLKTHYADELWRRA